jgi:pimeloyl-ACP methyl ester carboxylesterase
MLTSMKTPVMMVHGMSCTGEVWSGFKAFFEQRGTRVYTPTLRPEVRCSVKSRPHAQLRELRLEHYIEDLENEARRIEAECGVRPAVIGHSMGGLLAQVLAERGCVSAAVFVTPSAPAGVANLRSRVFWSVIAAVHALRIAPWAIKVQRARLDRDVFNILPADARQAAHDAMVYESARAFLQLANWPVDESKITVPTLTVAALGDRLIPSELVRLTANKYAAVGGEFREYSEHGHWLYAEPGWEKPAADIYEWLLIATGESRADELADNARVPGPHRDADAVSGARE